MSTRIPKNFQTSPPVSSAPLETPDLPGDRAEDAMEALFQQTSDFDLTFTLHTAVPKKHA